MIRDGGGVVQRRFQPGGIAQAGPHLGQYFWTPARIVQEYFWSPAKIFPEYFWTPVRIVPNWFPAEISPFCPVSPE